MNNQFRRMYRHIQITRKKKIRTRTIYILTILSSVLGVEEAPSATKYLAWNVPPTCGGGWHLFF